MEKKIEVKDSVVTATIFVLMSRAQLLTVAAKIMDVLEGA